MQTSLLLESIISKHSASKTSFVKLVCITEETCLSLALMQTPKTGFVVSRPIYDCCLSVDNFMALKCYEHIFDKTFPLNAPFYFILGSEFNAYQM